MNVKVAALMTAPRYECTWARNIIEGALKRCQIPLVVSGGVFYGQCMQRMLNDQLEAGVDMVLTIDFDSIFTHADVTELLGRCWHAPEIDALAALQSRRGQPYPLFTVGNSTRVEFNGAPLQVDGAHFGLTAIKLDRLRDIPKPWFWSTPDENGDWVDNKVDEDIYFWRKWREHGRTCFVDAGVSIGHLEEVVAKFDEDGNHCYQYQNDWYNENVAGDPKAAASRTIEVNDAINETDNADDVSAIAGRC